VTVQNSSVPWITASPNPILVPVGSPYGVTTINWDAPGYPTAQVRVGSPTGSLFNQGASSSVQTGDWVTNGMVFYLISASGGTTLATVPVYLQNPTLTASPNPILVPAGSPYGVTTITYNAPGYTNAQIHVGSPTGTLFASGASGAATTGDWVTNGMVFYFVDENTNTTLQTLTAYTQSDSIDVPNSSTHYLGWVQFRLTEKMPSVQRTSP
jgi:hypothetical protein